MFLFTTPASTANRAAPASVADVVRDAAAQSGVSFDYLLATAKRESALNPSAKASTSSARGLFQFVEQTWLRMVQTRGDAYGLANEAQAIAGRAGRLTVADSAARARILALRDDPKIASGLAAELTRENADGLTRALNRAPTQGELYMAHFLGLGGAARLIRQAEATPDAAAASHFPDAARANRSIFYDRQGRARSLAEVQARLGKGFADGQAVTAVARQEVAPAETGNPFHRLFRSDAASPAAKAVAASFLPLAERREPVGAPLDIRPAPTFFSMRNRG